MESNRRNIEFEAVKSRTHSLVTLLRNCIPTFATECLTRGLISEDVDEITSTDNTDSEKAKRLLRCVRDRIRNEPSLFYTLIDVLKGYDFLEGEARILEDKYSEW